MYESYSKEGGRSSRDIFLKAHRFIQRCMRLGSVVFIIAIVYIAYIKIGYNRDMRSIENVISGVSRSEQTSSMHSVAIALQPEKVRSYVASPITNVDVENLHEFAAEYHKVHEQLMREFNRIGWSEDENDVSKIRIFAMLANQVVTTFFSYNKSPGFDKVVAAHGGYEKYYSGVFGFAGVLAAIDAVALSHNVADKYSDEIIELVLSEQTLVRAQYDNGIIETEEGEVDAKAVIMASGPGIVALVKVPRASFEAWRALSVDERSRIAEEMSNFREGEFFLGVAFDPAKIFRQVFVNEFNASN